MHLKEKKMGGWKVEGKGVNEGSGTAHVLGRVDQVTGEGGLGGLIRGQVEHHRSFCLLVLGAGVDLLPAAE